MADDATPNELISLTADIVAAHVSNNVIATADVAPLIQSIYGALAGLGAPAEPAPAEKPKGAVSVRSSIKHEHLISMIDGKPYKMLRRHLGQNGYTPESYREAFGLPRDYPMVASAYAETRRALAHKIGLGRKPAPAAAAPKPASRKPEAAAPAPKPLGRKPKAAAPAAKPRGRKPAIPAS